MPVRETIYKAADYLRLSKDDGDFSVSSAKQESNSISSQRELIKQFVKSSPDLELVAEPFRSGQRQGIRRGYRSYVPGARHGS